MAAAPPPDEDMSFVISDIESGFIAVYIAASDVGAQDGTEITAEPGVSGSIGPDLAARMTVRIDCITLDGVQPANRVGNHTEMTSQTAEQQYQTLRLLKKRGLYLSSRIVPDVEKVWAIENVKASDTLEDTNHFTVDVSFIELIGGADALRNGGGVPSLGSIIIPIPPPTPTTSAGSIPTPDPNAATGAGQVKCVQNTAGVALSLVDVAVRSIAAQMESVADTVVTSLKDAVSAIGLGIAVGAAELKQAVAPLVPRCPF